MDANNILMGLYEYWATQMREGANVDYCNDCQTLYICSRRGCLDKVAQQATEEAQVIEDRGGFDAEGMNRLIEEVEAGPRLSDATLEEITEEVKRRQSALDEWAAAAPFDIPFAGRELDETCCGADDWGLASTDQCDDCPKRTATTWKLTDQPGVWTNMRDIEITIEGTLVMGNDDILKSFTFVPDSVTLDDACDDEECCGADEEIGHICDDCPNRIDDETAEWMNASMGPYTTLESVEEEYDPEKAAIVAVAEMLWAQDLTTNEIIARMIGTNVPHSVSVNVEGDITPNVDLVGQLKEAFRGLR